MKLRSALLPLLLATVLSAPAVAQKRAAQADPLEQALKGTTREAGLLPVHIDRKGGRVLLSLSAPDAEGLSGRFIYVTALETGLGSAPVGLDRSLSGGSKILVFRRVGKKVVAEIENARFRATAAPAAEQAGVRESFAYSAIWMGDVAAETADGGFVADLSSFLARDDIGIAQALKNGGAGEFKLEPSLSVADAAATRVFPKNIELEARLTFVSTAPTAEANNISPVSGNLAFIVRHSLVALPEPGFEPRRFDPRAGSFGTQVVDFAQPLGRPIVYQLANRFRLEKEDPSAPRSRVKKPIIFYIDRAAPEPIRTALYEGVSWWKQAFDEAGLIDAFQVEILPEGADPLDIRYNVVNWVNRATRGWSYGQAIDDPRTGEIIKGQVLLGSLRVRQDMLIFEGLVGADKVGKGGPNDPVQAALARIRQLGAHEVGHALGFAHNFGASGQGRYSVMDYPAPRVGLANGEPDLSDAYGIGIGRWDRFAVDWLYGADDEAEARQAMNAALAEGLRYVAEADARPAGAAHPWGGLWDDAADPTAELQRMMEVRRVAVSRFGPRALAEGEAVANLRRKFVPIWLLHRYQVEAAAKLIGGVEFGYAVKGDGAGAARPVAAAEQGRALDALLATLRTDALTVPQSLLPHLSLGWSGEHDRQETIEIFRTAGSNVFDPLAASEVGAAVTLASLLAPERLNRLEIQSSADAAIPSANDLIDRVFATVLPSGASGVVQRRIATTAILAVARVQRDPALSPTLAFSLSERLERLGRDLARVPGTGAHADWSRGLGRVLTDREALHALLAEPRRVPQIPPGMPIGGEGGGA